MEVRSTTTRIATADSRDSRQADLMAIETAGTAETTITETIEDYLLDRGDLLSRTSTNPSSPQIWELDNRAVLRSTISRFDTDACTLTH